MPKQYKDLSKKELWDLLSLQQLKLPQLGTAVPALLRDALSVTDQRHCNALLARLSRWHDPHIYALLRVLCKAAGHRPPPDCLYPDKECTDSLLVSDQSISSSTRMTFSKVVSTFDYYKTNSAKFAEKADDRQSRLRDIMKILRGAVQDVVRQVSDQEITEEAADQHLQEWSSADKVARQACGIVCEQHASSFWHGTGSAKEALVAYSSIIKHQEFVEGVPLLTALAVDIIQDRIAQQDVAAKFSKDEPLELFSVDCDEVFGA